MSLKKYMVERYNLSALDRSERIHQRCVKWIREVLEEPYPKSLLWNMKEKGCTLPIEKIICEPCSNNDVHGLYDIETKEVVLCENNVTSKKNIVNTLCHELIHAFDDCRNIFDNNSLKHMACGEVRAVNLHTDNWFLKDRKDCVRKHAIKSLLEQGNLDEAQAAATVESIFDDCFNDTQPFDRIAERTE